MNWYKKSQLFKKAEKTLYHGTSINHMDSIREFGLIPQVGQFVEWGYGAEFEEAGIEMPELVFMTDKEELDKAVGAMTSAVGAMLGKDYHDVSSKELERYGMLVIIPGSPGSDKGARGIQRRPQSDTGEVDEEWDRYYSSDYPTVEPGDYFSDDVVGRVKVLIGKKMIQFLIKNNALYSRTLWNKGDKQDLRDAILNRAIKRELAKNPDANVQELLQKGRKELDAADPKRLQDLSRMYLE